VPRRALALVALLTAALTAAVAHGGGTTTFDDAGGDSGAAPDVTRVDLSMSSARLRFDVTTSPATGWGGGGAYLMVDSDANYATGHDDGVDFLFTLHRDHSFDAGRWNGRDNFDPYGSRAKATVAGDTLALTIPLAELGAPARLAFAVLTFAAGDASDEAPDGSFAPGTPPRWSYSPAGAATVESISARFTPSVPVHGKPFALARVTARLSSGATRTHRGAACSARPRALAVGTGCRFRVPAAARGKRLAVTVRAGGVSRLYGFRVR
jgi:hypothetical protein